MSFFHLGVQVRILPWLGIIRMVFTRFPESLCTQGPSVLPAQFRSLVLDGQSGPLNHFSSVVFDRRLREECSKKSFCSCLRSSRARHTSAASPRAPQVLRSTSTAVARPCVRSGFKLHATRLQRGFALRLFVWKHKQITNTSHISSTDTVARGLHSDTRTVVSCMMRTCSPNRE